MSRHNLSGFPILYIVALAVVAQINRKKKENEIDRFANSDLLFFLLNFETSIHSFTQCSKIKSPFKAIYNLRGYHECTFWISQFMAFSIRMFWLKVD